jgi:hypothetical protein
VTLKVDGAKSLTKKLNSRGEGNFSVSFKLVGTYTITMTNTGGTVLFTQVVTVHPKYPASGFKFTVSNPTPAPGGPFTVNMTGGRANTAIILTVTSKVTSLSSDGIDIAGTKAFSVMRDASSAAAWTVTLTEAGAYTLVATNTAGTVRDTRTVTVGAAPAATVGSLSRTGFDPTGLLVGGGLLLLAGTGAVVVAKRRKSSQAAA